MCIVYMVYMKQKYYLGSEMEEVNLLLKFLKNKRFFPQLSKDDKGFELTL